jgi:hypothetical protein
MAAFSSVSLTLVYKNVKRRLVPVMRVMRVIPEYDRGGVCQGHGSLLYEAVWLQAESMYSNIVVAKPPISIPIDVHGRQHAPVVLIRSSIVARPSAFLLYPVPDACASYDILM